MAESENIVAETAEKIFADLADAQTINNDKKGSWKAPLWQALTEAGLPLSWVPEDCNGSGASLAEGFQRAQRRGAFCDRRAARRNHAGGLAAGAGEDRFPRRRNDGGARKPEGPHHAQRRRHAVRPRARRPLCQGRQTYRGARRRQDRRFDRADRRQHMPDRGRPQSRRRSQRYRDARSTSSRSRSSRRRRVSTRRN